MSEKTTYYQRNRDIILNRANNNNNKDELREKTKNKCGELSEEKK